ncbi:unnamed protein product [Clonostachys rosea f. rosea IK726]|uniref:Uncharacterized protein n=1 Tax=Clonostachys rosea f. rosea IK726 TaxID=1349383 RepID=A0ACA9U1C3_BIOOC|nr:unnamed protein product [Clonostachys rosea f. rosea IK726]
MDKLSQEIIDLICGHLVSNDEEERLKLWTYRCLSRQWQAALERRAYASVSILSDDADDFVRKLNPDRARYVREVHFHAMSNHPEPLRENEAARYPRYGDDGGHTALLANLTTIMKHMAKWEVEYPIFFSISGTYLRLNEKSLLKFPIIKNITTFSCIVKNMDPIDSCNLATRMPELREFRFAIQHHTKEQRSDLADEIGTWGEKLPHLESLEILGEYDIRIRQKPAFHPEDMRNEAGVDRLCQELRLLSQKRGFKHLRMEHFPISRELFEDTLNPEANMSWPTLEEFMVLPHEISSTGEWFFLEDHGRGNLGDIKGFRYKNDDAAQAPIIELFSRATSLESSPAMKRAGLGFRTEVPIKNGLRVGYHILVSSKGKEEDGSLKGKEDMDALFNFRIRDGSD